MHVRFLTVEIDDGMRLRKKAITGMINTTGFFLTGHTDVNRALF